MPKGRPAASGYAKLAQAEEEEEEEEDYHDEDAHESQRALPNDDTQYAPIQPQRQSSRMQAVGSPSTSRRSFARPRRSNSGVDIKAINQRLERWADEIASKFKMRRVRGKTEEEEQLEIHHSVFQAPDWIRPATAEVLASDWEMPGDRLSKLQYDDLIESVRVAIELGVHPKLISRGSSGSYFARNPQGKVIGVFKPRDEEPYANRNPKLIKWLHRNFFPFAFGRHMLIPNSGWISDAAAYVLDTHLRINIVPYTEVVSLSSIAFHYDWIERRRYYRKKRPLPDKTGSLQYFLKGYKDASDFLKEHPWPDRADASYTTQELDQAKKRGWTDSCRPGASSKDEEAEEISRPPTAREAERRKEFWTPTLQKSFREELEKLVILDYIMRNTDRGLDNWMIRINKHTNEAKIVAHPPSQNGSTRHYDSTDGDPYGRREQMAASERTLIEDEHEPKMTVSIGAIDNSLSWPWKHPDAWRSYPFGWLFLPASVIGQPFSDTTRNHFLPLLTSKQWWSETQLALRECFQQDPDFKERMFARQMAIVKGQAWNVVETLKTPDHGPLELTRRARVCVWDDIVEIPVVFPLRVPSAELRRRTAADQEADGDIATSAPTQPQHDLLDITGGGSSTMPNGNRFNLSRQNSTNDVRESIESTGTPLSPGTIQNISWDSGTKDTPSERRSKATNARPISKARMSYEDPRRLRASPGKNSGRRLSMTLNRRGSVLGSMGGWGLSDEEDDGDLGYAAAEDMEHQRKKVIVERLETVKAKHPVFTWC